MRRTVRIAVLAAVLVAVVSAGAGAAGVAGTAAAAQVGPAVLADFNGDGIDDLVVGVPGEDLVGAAVAGVVDILTDLAVGVPGENVGTAVDAGAVSVLDSADDGSGLPAGAVQDRYFQGTGGVPGASERGDLFAASVAA